MSLSSGTQLGPYQVLSSVGAGGMGEVYRARDVRLGREVAIKVLPGDVAADPERRARFEREARAVAALEHPHICGIYDVGEANGTHYLVMPLLEGQTLAARLEQGPLPIAEALTVAGEMADALDKAHRQGIVHRDLKPANVMLTKSGVKLLDFGLAKLRGRTSAVTFTDAAPATTTAAGATGTAAGTILGTIHYMAPEQVEGKAVDHRADLWALGAVLYEMVTGTRPFQGETAASVMGAILKDTPSPMSSRQVLTPPALDRLVATCLEKDPDSRWQSARDVRQVLRLPLDSSVTVPTVIQAVRPSTLRAATLGGLAVAAVAGIVAIVPTWVGIRREPSSPPIHVALLPPAGTQLSSPPASAVAPQIAVSPDGTHVAFVAQANGERPALWVRSLSAATAVVLRGTEDAIYPFWSPDNRSLGFFSQGKLRIVDVAGGPPRTLASAGLDSRGGSWGPDGTILFAPSNGGLARTSSSGGPVSLATRLDAARGETSHRFPWFLPDGRHFLFTTRTKDDTDESFGVWIASLDSPAGKLLVPRTAFAARFAPPSHILFLRSGTLMAQEFDATRLELMGEAMEVASSVGATTTGHAAFSASQTGVIAYSPSIDVPGQLKWFDRTGRETGRIGTRAEYLDFELAPDQKTLAMSRIDDPGLAAADIWLLDLVRNVAMRLISHSLNDASVLWKPGGDEVAFRSNRHGYTQLWQKRAAGVEPERVVLDTGVSLIPSDWSSDGKWIFFTETQSSSGFDIRVWPVGGAEQPTVVARTTQNATHGRLSPNGHWLAYASDESGEWQVWVQPFPTTGERRQVSSSGGSEPRWRGDGRELFYLAPDGTIMSVAVEGADGFHAAAPRPLFSVEVPLFGSPYRNMYTTTRDGQRFLVNTRVERTPPSINVILNASSLLRGTAKP